MQNYRMVMCVCHLVKSKYPWLKRVKIAILNEGSRVKAWGRWHCGDRLTTLAMHQTILHISRVIPISLNITKWLANIKENWWCLRKLAMLEECRWIFWHIINLPLSLFDLYPNLFFIGSTIIHSADMISDALICLIIQTYVLTIMMIC